MKLCRSVGIKYENMESTVHLHTRVNETELHYKDNYLSGYNAIYFNKYLLECKASYSREHYFAETPC